MTNPKNLHLEQLEAISDHYDFSEDARKDLKRFLLEAKRNDATYLLSFIHDFIPEDMRQRIAKEYSY